MEKKEAVREYCIEKTLFILQRTFDDPINRPVNVDDVIKTAKKLEEYITGTQYPVGYVGTNCKFHQA